MAYGENTLEKGAKGPEVVELQMRLAGFAGTTPDGDFGPGTQGQVRQFQSDWMKETAPSGIADAAVFDAIEALGRAHSFDLEAFRCGCGTCSGFGQGRFKGQYRDGKPQQERFHMYEYPGIHRMLLWAYRAARFYAKERMGRELIINSGYRCEVNNQQKGRRSTNHMGKAIDIDIPGHANQTENRQLADDLRALLADTAKAQVGWGSSNRKALEPASIAPTWCHYDVRSYDSKYLDDKYFVKTAAELDAAPA
ncbi:MAG: peptidoglycan-binding protein [Kiloniellales bacterium]